LATVAADKLILKKQTETVKTNEWELWCRIIYDIYPSTVPKKLKMNDESRGETKIFVSHFRENLLAKKVSRITKVDFKVS
jgi:hypothetical protein